MRRRVGSLLVVLVAIVVAAAMVQATGDWQRVSSARFQVGRAPASVLPGLAVSFDRPVLAGAWGQVGGDVSRRTSQAWVVVAYTAETTRGEPRSFTAVLRTRDGARHDSVTSMVVPPAGTRCRGTLVYEVPFDAVEGARVVFQESSLASYYDAGGTVELGLDRATVDSLAPRRDDVVATTTCADTTEVLR